MKSEITRLYRKTGIEVAEQWKAQYFTRGEWFQGLHNVLSAEEVYQNILANQDDPDAVDRITKGWTLHHCSSCSREFSDGVNMLEPDYDTTPTFCIDCIRKAAQLLGLL